jgi:hypothetical protein
MPRYTEVNSARRRNLFQRLDDNYHTDVDKSMKRHYTAEDKHLLLSSFQRNYESQ